MPGSALSNHAEGLRVFDPQRLNRHVHTSQERALAVFDIVSHVLSAGTTPVEQTRAAFTSAQQLQAAQILHNLKASAGNLGGLRVSEIASELEQLLAARATQQMVTGLLDRLEQELVEFLAAVDEWLRLNKGSADGAQPAQHSKDAVQMLKQNLTEQKSRLICRN